MTARRRALALVLGAALASAAGGCGGDAGGPRLSRAQYVKRGDAICSRYTARIKALGSPEQLTDIAPYIAKALPELSRTVDQLGRLRPPKELDAAFARYLAAARATRKRAFDLRDAASRADSGAVQRLLGQAARAGSATDALARRAGLEACVEGGA